jgi:two-component system response regulator AlgR
MECGVSRHAGNSSREIRILVVDDELLARDRLVALVEELGAPYVVAGTSGNGMEAVAFCTAQGADIVLMDVRMPVMDGLQAAGELSRLRRPPSVIFTTAYEDHALQAFDHEAVDYLLKPVRRERLGKALQRAQRINLSQLQGLLEEREAPEYITATHLGGVQRIPLRDVIYLRAESKYVVVRHQQGECLVEESLKSFESRFPEHFLRVHRNGLVVRAAVLGLEKGVGGMQITLRGCEERLEVSRRHLAEVRRFLKEGE